MIFFSSLLYFINVNCYHVMIIDIIIKLNLNNRIIFDIDIIIYYDDFDNYIKDENLWIIFIFIDDLILIFLNISIVI